MKRIRSNFWVTLSIFWPFIPCLALSALLHTTDADVGNFRALASAEILGSILAWSFPFALGAAASLAALSAFGLRGFGKAVLSASGVLGLSIALLGTSAVTPLGVMGSVVGSALVVLIFFVVAVLPHLIVVLRGALTARA